MLSPTAFDLFIKYFDAVDRAVTARLARKRPWLEPALTSLLCDLLDEDTQEDQLLSYTFAQLNADLREFDGLIEMHVRLDTHEYPPEIERWVTQSDLGFVIKFDDLMLPSDSWTASWLMQAKRLYPTSRNPVQYDETSRFGGTDSKQRARIDKLTEATGLPFVKYLLYCPRVDALDDIARQKMTHLHNKALADNIFDYTYGLQLYHEIRRADNSLAAGLLVSDPDNLPGTFGAAHSRLLNQVTPLAWFLAHQFTGRRPDIAMRERDMRSRGGRRPPSGSPPEGPDFDWAHGIVTGDPGAVDRILSVFNRSELEVDPFLPPHTLTIGVSVGHRLDPERRQIRLG